MIESCEKKDIKSIFEYIGEDYGKCLYIFIDLKKYGLENENFNVWIQYNDLNEICCIITEYYNGIQIYSKSYDLNASEIASFIKNMKPTGIFGMEKTIEKIYEYFPNYKKEIGSVAELKDLKYPPNNDAYSASLDELTEIVELIAEDENLGKPYGFESLYSQFYERKLNNFGRNFILRDKKSNDIICHAGTYAEIPELAVISGVITSIPYRGKGYSKGTLSSLCYQLNKENKRIFSYFYIPAAENMHYGVGFDKIGNWVKLIK